MKFIQKFIVSPTELKMNPQRLPVVLRTENEEPEITFISAHLCRGHIPQTNTVITTYRIAAGPTDTSVILLKKTDCPYNNRNNLKQCYEIFELIEYLTSDYVNSF